MGGELDLMRRIVGAWEGLDATDAPEAFTKVSWMDPAVQLEPGPLELPDETTWVGIDQVGEGWRRWLAQWGEYRVSGSHLEQIGDQILLDLHVEATGRISGVPVTIEHVQVWGWRDGKVVSIRIFEDRAAALDAINRSARGGDDAARTPPAP